MRWASPISQPALHLHNNLSSMRVDHRRILGPFGVLALVLLRLVIGWHFFGEGTKKLQYDRHDREFHLVFSADKELLDKAKGPLAEWYFAYVPDEHGWRHLFATPRENVRPTAAQIEEQKKWLHDYNARRAVAAKKPPADKSNPNQSAAVEFPPSAPYHDWAAKIAEDWRALAEKVKAVPGMTDAQKQRVDRALENRLESLSEYLAEQDEAMTAYRHDLWRLDNWRTSKEAKDVPFYQERIASKTAETTGQLKTWRAAVQTMEAGYLDDLDRIRTAEQRDQPATAKAFREAITDPHQARLDTLNIVVTALTIGVGACLLLGLFTRLASIAGAVFLVGVIASQPFWLSDALNTMPQWIECAALLVLAGTKAGRWFGLDFFTYAMWNTWRHRND
jgi:uncharacterized membrane protein YphA (DoxX/SURF4 family)